MPRTSRIFCSQIVIFSQFQVYLIKAKIGKTNNKSIAFSIIFYPAISYRRVQKESDELSYTVCGHSLWSASQLPARVVEELLDNFN